MIKMIKLILERYIKSYKEYFDKFCQIKFIYRPVVIPVFTFIYMLTFLVLLIIISIIILLTRPISIIYKPHKYS